MFLDIGSAARVLEHALTMVLAQFGKGIAQCPTLVQGTVQSNNLLFGLIDTMQSFAHGLCAGFLAVQIRSAIIGVNHRACGGLEGSGIVVLLDVCIC